jgi:hypothetical protein
MSMIEQELKQVEANLGNIEQLQYLAGLLATLNAALLDGNQQVSRVGLVRLKARLERLAASVYAVQHAVERRIQSIRAELTDVD